MPPTISELSFMHHDKMNKAHKADSASLFDVNSGSDPRDILRRSKRLKNTYGSPQRLDKCLTVARVTSEGNVSSQIGSCELDVNEINYPTHRVSCEVFFRLCFSKASGLTCFVRGAGESLERCLVQGTTVDKS